MIGKYLKNFVTLLLLASFIFAPYFISVQKVEAQSYPSSAGFSYGQGIGGYIKGLAPAIAQLPLCKNKISGAVKNLFTKLKGVLSSKKGKSQSLEQVQSRAQVVAQSVPVDNSDIAPTLDDINAKQDELQKSVNSIDENDTCLKSIGRMVIKMLLQKFTLSTVEWIKSGFEGDPAFIQDPKRFWGDIARDEILQMGGELNDGKLFPFGKAFMQSVANRYNKKFQDNARYSLNEFLKATNPQYSSAGFKADFRVGGWLAWNYMTQVPANNPVGFQMLAMEDLSKRLDGTFKSKATKANEALAQANGYLGDMRCADPEGLTKAQDKAALAAGKMEYESSGPSIPDGNGGFIQQQTPTGHVLGTCRRWEYVTPGKMIAEWGTKIVNYPDNSLLKAEDLNDAVATLIDATIAHYSEKFMQDGFADFSSNGSDGYYQLNFDHMNGNTDPSQTEKDFTDNHISSSQWLIEHPNFNIRTDLNQAIIDEQRTFIDKLENQNIAIPKLIKTIRQLDYCIPGPNPKWAESSSVDEFYNTIKINPDPGANELVQYSSIFDPSGIIGGIAAGLFDEDRENQIKMNMARYLENTFDVRVYWGQDQVLSAGHARELTENMFESYRQVIYDVYFAGPSKSLAPMPLVTNEARAEFNKIPGYQQIFENNEDDIVYKNSVVKRLGQIKDAIDALNPNQLEILDPAGEAALKPWLLYFGRLTKDMVTGNDVAKADDLWKDLLSKEKYIFDDLLRGPGGCEAELAELQKMDPKRYDKFVRRQPYPLEVYYFYGNSSGGSSGGGPQPPNPDYIKYFGDNISGMSGAWVGNGGSGTWWNSGNANGINIFNGVPGQGNWTATSTGGGTWTGNIPNAGPNVGGTWNGSGGQGYWVGTCTSGQCSGTWGGGNGSGINGGGYAPTSGQWYGSQAGAQTISGNWTFAAGGTGTWTGTLLQSINVAVGTWSGAVGLGNAGTWQSGNPPTGGGNTGGGTTGGGNTGGCGGVSSTSGPCWDKSLLEGWDPNQGFLYGAVFWNFWQRPYDGPPNTGYEPTGEDLPDLAKIAAATCPDHFINIIEFSRPGPDEYQPQKIKDIGGLDPEGYGTGDVPYDIIHNIQHDNLRKNVCGIITRKFEKIFGIY